MPVSLEAYRDLLMPAAVGKDAELVVNYNSDNIVAVLDGGEERIIVSRNEIDDNIWEDAAFHRLKSLPDKGPSPDHIWRCIQGTA
jgi:hypothetical protein